jgi:YgiT-type zinc finger domain-containing protein
MKSLEKLPCSECGGSLKEQLVSQQFEREGTLVEVAGVRALVCQKCGETYFVPGGAQAITQAANSLFEVAKRNGQHKGKLTGKVKVAPRKLKAA